ncbi:methyl-accepting chemotaxis protein [Motiliproteus sediminis]|uniref:methyl-accepting chemotaxis protein n=1 Tax=Motiliproteus sediminis TaxID=1468178 RepID=UPI001AEFFCAC|nr:methyl-accepting chemotaxis protein [Motiliproteus sediminis]
MNISIRARLTVLAVVPVTLLAIMLLIVTQFETESLSRQQSMQARESLVAVKRTEAKAYMEMAYSAVKDIYESGGELEQALPILRNLKYGDSGYIFGYTSKGTRVFLGQSDKGLGDNFWDLTDTQGNKLVQQLIAAGRQGGGYVTYYFPKPGATEAEPKLSYALYLDRWDLMIGTGFYMDDVNAVVESIETSASKTQGDMAAYLIGISVVLLLGAIVFGVLISRSIMKPLRSITESMETLATGDGDLTARLDEEGPQELGRLARGFNAFVGSLQQMIGQVRDVAHEVTERTSVMAAQIDEINGLLRSQHDETDQVATAMSEMSASAHEVSQSASHTASSAGEADQNSRHAAATVQSSRQVVHSLAGYIDSSNEAIKALEGNVHEIASIVDVIQGIAEQTNLLALNAAIEAARAGEQGRGFAVVADEVRSLATKTHESTDEIHKMIEKLKAGSTAAVQAMESSHVSSQEAVERSRAASEELDAITAHIHSVQEQSAVIATAAEEQNQVSDEIAQRIVHISDQSQQSSEIAEQNRASGAELARQANTLRELVGRFKIS